MLSKDEILHIAKLAKLNLTDEEVERLRTQLSPVLDYVDQLNELDTDNIEPTFHPIADQKNKFQEEGMDESLPVSDVTRNSEDNQDNYVLTEGVL